MYRILTPLMKLDSFTLSMMKSVLAEHAEVTDHDSKFCCEVAKEYRTRVDAHNKLTAGEKPVKAEPVENPLTPKMAGYIVRLYKKIPSHLLSPAMREQAERVAAQEEISFEVGRALIDALKALEPSEEAKASRKESAVVRYATEPQVKYLRSLLTRREHSYEVDMDALELTIFADARNMIEHLKDAPYKANATVQEKKPKAVPEEGIYQVGEDIYKVQKNKASGSGQSSYAKKFDKAMEAFVYVGQKPFSLLTEDNKMTLAQAKVFGDLYGICVRCGRDLTDEESIAAGLGKICITKF